MGNLIVMAVPTCSSDSPLGRWRLLMTTTGFAESPIVGWREEEEAIQLSINLEANAFEVALL